MYYLYCLDEESCQIGDESLRSIYFSGSLQDGLRFMRSYYGESYCDLGFHTDQFFLYFNPSFLWTLKTVSHSLWTGGKLGSTTDFIVGEILTHDGHQPVYRIGNDLYFFYVISNRLAKQIRCTIPDNIDIQKYDDTLNPIFDKLSALKGDFDKIIDKVEPLPTILDNHIKVIEQKIDSLYPVFDSHVQVIESKIDSFVPSLDSSLDSSLVAFNNSLTTTTTSLTKDVLSASFAETVDTYFKSFGGSLTSISQVIDNNGTKLNEATTLLNSIL